MYELHAPNGSACAYPYINRRRRRPVSLPDGAIVEDLPDGMGAHLPRSVPAFLWVDSAGRPVSEQRMRRNPDLTVFLAGFVGFYLLPDGQPAGLYNCEARPITVGQTASPDSVTE